jgi:hypothetical protein
MAVWVFYFSLGFGACVGHLRWKLLEKIMLKAAISIALFAGLMSTSAFAAPPTDAETKYCAHDYRQYCGEDGIGSNLLTLCMRKHGKELSGDCIKALEAAGELTPAEKSEADKAGD